MDEQQAEQVATAVGGEAWNSGGGIWLVLCRRSDGKIVAISDDAVCEYSEEDQLDGGTPDSTIPLH